MPRLSKTGSKASKAKAHKASQTKGRKSALTKRRSAPAAKPRKRRSVSGLEAQLRRRTIELNEALEQQAATAEILEIINTSQGDLAPVFDIILEKAHHLCDVTTGSLELYEGDIARSVATRGMNDHWDRYLRKGYRITEGIRPGYQATHPRQMVDMRKLVDRFPDETIYRDFIEIGGLRTLLALPLVKDGIAFGRIVATRAEVRPFTDRQIALLKSFADQAVVAIENARLFKETKEALERQTATADILKVIASSPDDVQPAFDAIAERSKRLVNALSTTVFRLVDGVMHLRAFTPTSPEADATLEAMFPAPLFNFSWGDAINKGDIYRVIDTDLEIQNLRELARLRGFRSMLFVPLLSGQTPIGLISVTRVEPGPFVDHHVQLLQTFADQAVIAIQNVRMFDEVQARTRDLTEALQQQTATADVLKVISRSAFDLNMVTTAILQAAAQLCRAPLATLHLRDGDVCRLVTQFGLPEAFEQVSRDNPIPARYPLHSRRQVRAGEFAQFTDAWSDSDYLYKAVAKLGGYRAIIVIPMMREDELVGIFSLARPEPEPFTPGQIKLVQTFADQAAIAIENARLFNETHEALEQQKASADILSVISNSVADTQPVFDKILESCKHLFGGDELDVLLVDDQGQLNIAAYIGDSHDVVAATFPAPVERTPAGRAIRERRVMHWPDLVNGEDVPGVLRKMAKLIGYRSMVFAPMLWEGRGIGAIGVARSTGPFKPKELAMLQTFADQAVIAIQNARLFDEVQAKTIDLSESLQQQTATADVLKVISRSAFDLQTVLETLTQSAMELSSANRGIMLLRDGDLFRFRAHSHADENPDWIKFLREHPQKAGRNSASARSILSGQTVCVPDVLADPEIDMPATALAGIRAVLAVPLLRDGKVEGIMVLSRPTPGPFNARQIDLVQTFADQAVIAIENARLFDEVQAKTADLSEALQQQTATAEVLKVISRSAFDLDVVLNSLTKSAVELCNSTYGAISLYRDGALVFMAQTGCTPEFAELLWSNPARLDRKSVTGRTGLLRTIVQVPDVLQDEDYDYHGGEIIGNYRSASGVPLLRNGELEGVFTLMRREPGNFTPRQIELVQTFADQAVIAIENVRLFDEVQARTKELAASLDDLRTAQDRLVQTEKLASLGQLTAGIAHEIKNPLNFVNNFSALSAELTDELNDILKSAALGEKMREEVDELTGLLKDNLEKVVQHGKRADSIVKNMLLHSREGSGEHRPADINALLDESLNLAYHGARAESPQFNITLQRDFDEMAGTVEVFPQEITRAFLNLISNGFYAATKRKTENGGSGFEPVLRAATKNLGNSVEIRIRDNGTGIPTDVKEKIFNPFFTTKPAGEGTGLGLSMSYDIVVKQHGGKIEVETEQGFFTEFIITLPRATITQKAAGGTN